MLRAKGAKYNKDGTLARSARAPRTYDDVTRITKERDARRQIDATMRKGALKGLDIAAKIPDVMPWAPTPLAAAAAVYKNWAPKGSEYYNPDKTTVQRAFGTARSLADVAVAHGVGVKFKNPVIGYFAGLASSKLGTPSAAKGGIVRGSGHVNVHNKELIVAKKKVLPLIKLMKKKGVALPLSAIRANSAKRRK